MKKRLTLAVDYCCIFLHPDLNSVSSKPTWIGVVLFPELIKRLESRSIIHVVGFECHPEELPVWDDSLLALTMATVASHLPVGEVDVEVGEIQVITFCSVATSARESKKLQKESWVDCRSCVGLETPMAMCLESPPPPPPLIAYHASSWYLDHKTLHKNSWDQGI